LARPRSDEKRKAILDAALEIFAECGTDHAPTAAISKAAGVAEGSLFTYFKTKDELMNELYLELRRESNRYLGDIPQTSDPRARLRYIWDKFLEYGSAHPKRLKVMAQLRSSGKLYGENETPAMGMTAVMDAVREVVAGKELESAPTEFVAWMLRAQAEITVQYIQAHPGDGKVCSDLGFKMAWASLEGQ